MMEAPSFKVYPQALAACLFAQDVVKDLKVSAKGSRSPFRREFVLPDGVSNFRGYVRVRVHAHRARTCNARTHVLKHV